MLPRVPRSATTPATANLDTDLRSLAGAMEAHAAASSDPLLFAVSQLLHSVDCHNEDGPVPDPAEAGLRDRDLRDDAMRVAVAWLISRLVEAEPQER